MFVEHLLPLDVASTLLAVADAARDILSISEFIPRLSHQIHNIVFTFIFMSVNKGYTDY
jgi:hypothetical protein